MTEQQLHRLCAGYLSWALARPWPAVWTTFPSGGGGEMRGKILRGMGLRAGWTDLEIIHAGRFHGIELKTDKGRLSASQVICHAEMIAAGGRVAVVRSLDELKAQLDAWEIPLRPVRLDTVRDSFARVLSEALA